MFVRMRGWITKIFHSGTWEHRKWGTKEVGILQEYVILSVPSSPIFWFPVSMDNLCKWGEKIEISSLQNENEILTMKKSNWKNIRMEFKYTISIIIMA